MDDEIKKIVCMIKELDDLAYATYKPIVEEICARKASESEVEHLLDYMVQSRGIRQENMQRKSENC